MRQTRTIASEDRRNTHARARRKSPSRKNAAPRRRADRRRERERIVRRVSELAEERLSPATLPK
jgi:hypothetical protein